MILIIRNPICSITFPQRSFSLFHFLLTVTIHQLLFCFDCIVGVRVQYMRANKK